MGRVIRFEFQVPIPEEAIEFYSRTFGRKFEKMPGQQDYWFIITGEDGKEGIDGGLMKSLDGATRTTNSIEVPSMMNTYKK